MADGPLFGPRVLVAEGEYFLAVQWKPALASAGAMVLGPVPSVDTAPEGRRQPRR